MESKLLKVNAPGIHFARISSTDNNVAWDDFSFNDAFTAVPEPASVLLLGSAFLIWLARLGLRRMRATRAVSH